MSMLIVPEPLFDSNMSVEAYRLCSHDGSKIFDVQNLRVIDDIFSNPGLDIVESIGIEPFTGGKPLFADITHMQLMTGIPLNLKIDPKYLICIVPAKLIENEEDVQFIYKLINAGYQVGLNGYPSNPDSPLMESIKYIILDYRKSQFDALYFNVKRTKGKPKAVILNIPDMKAFTELQRDSNAYFAGNFYSQPITKGKATLSPIKVNLLHLLNDVNQEDFDLTDIVKTIARDPYITVSLLKFINSGATGIKTKIESIQQGIAILGQKAVRQWATVSLSVNLAEDRPNEITKLALVRAKFADELAGSFEIGVFQHELFMAGLFSLLDVMLEKPMKEALNEVFVDERIRDALLEKKGPFAPVLELVYAYERADWDRATILMIQNDVNMEQVRNAYLNALTWYRKLLRIIDDVREIQP